MEFEHDTPASAKDIALADAPKVTLQPYNDVQVDSFVADRSHQAEGSFAFETETTDAAAQSAKTAAPSHHNTALAAAIGTVIVFAVALLALMMTR